MGLIQKRLIQEAKETWILEEQKGMRDIGTSNNQPWNVVIDVDWATFENDGPALRKLQHLGVRLMSNAFRVICSDDLGKEAVRTSIKSVVITNVPDAKEGSVQLENGTVTLRGAFAKGADGCMGDLKIARTLEGML